MTKKLDYSRRQIVRILEHYHNPEALFEMDESGKMVRTPSHRAPFEAGAIMKADIDRGIESLDREERECIVRRYVIGTGGELDSIGKRAIRHMAGYLNGECVLHRWCAENGMFDHTNNRVILPEYLPPELEQFIKDICLDHCVSEECPKT